MAAETRNICKWRSMCAMTKPRSTMPVTAIATFLPTMVLHNAPAGLLGHTLRDFLAGSDVCRSATAPSSNWVVMCCLQLLWSSLFGGTAGPLDAGNGRFQQQSARALHRRDRSQWVTPGCPTPESVAAGCLSLERSRDARTPGR